MAFAPVVPMGGLVGLRFLERTLDRQLAAFATSPDIAREVDHFVAHAGDATTAEALVADRRLLRVALGAFGLEDEVDKRAFVRRVLEEGTLDPRALANRLADPSWRKLARTLGYGDLGGALGIESVRRDLADRFRLRQFERAVGEADVDLRLALHFKREIGEVAAAAGSGGTGWLRVLGSRPLRRVVEGAYGLPAGFAGLGLDRQRETLEARTRQVFGAASPAVFASAENVDTLLRRFLAAAAAHSGPAATTPGAAALALIRPAGAQGGLLGGLGAGASASLFASRL